MLVARTVTYRYKPRHVWDCQTADQWGWLTWGSFDCHGIWQSQTCRGTGSYARESDQHLKNGLKAPVQVLRVVRSAMKHLPLTSFYKNLLHRNRPAELSAKMGQLRNSSPGQSEEFDRFSNLPAWHVLRTCFIRRSAFKSGLHQVRLLRPSCAAGANRTWRAGLRGAWAAGSCPSKSHLHVSPDSWLLLTATLPARIPSNPGRGMSPSAMHHQVVPAKAAARLEVAWTGHAEPKEPLAQWQWNC